MDDHNRAMALCEQIEQDLTWIRLGLVSAEEAGDRHHDAASAVEAGQTLRRHCDDLFRFLIAQAFDLGVSPRTLDFPGD